MFVPKYKAVIVSTPFSSPAPEFAIEQLHELNTCTWLVYFCKHPN